MSTEALFAGIPMNELQPRRQADPQAQPRLRRPDRRQVILQACCLDELLAADHEARIVWAVVEKWDLWGFLALVKARGSVPGRAMTDPKVLVALWLYAYTQGVGCGRELARLCERHDAYRWICGGLSLNYHTLNDFRVGFETELDGLLTQMLAVLIDSNLVDVHRISQDGTRVRASAGAGSFKTAASLQEHLQAARRHVELLKDQGQDPNASRQKQAAVARAAQEKLSRVQEAIVQVQQVEQAKAAQKQKPSKDRAAKASTSDPQARQMRLPGGASRPGYNVQFAVAVQGRAIVGVEVSNAGSDAGLEEPMRRQVQQRSGQAVSEQLLDGGYVDLEQIERAAEDQVSLYMPVPKPRKPEVDRHAPRRGDSAAVREWRGRMGTPQAQAIYKQRASTVETANAETKTYRGLGPMLVRGLRKVRCIALWSALAYNLVHFGQVLAA